MRPIIKNSSEKSTTPKFSMAEAQAAVDRFSELPPEIAHHILSFLPVVDVTRVSSLSKRCTGLHLSNPTLNFNSFPSESTLTFDKRLELLNSLDRFLIQRGNSKVKHFSLEWTPKYHFGEINKESNFCLEKSRILGWIDYAVSCNVEELNVVFDNMMPTLLDVIAAGQVEFPSSVFLCESLRYLSLDMNKCATLEAPPFSTSPTSNLVSLRLVKVNVKDDEGFCKWVSYCCRFIKELVLVMIAGLEDITIESSSLESLSVCRCPFYTKRLLISGDRIEDIVIDWVYDINGYNNIFLTKKNGHNNENLLHISAPNLKHLKWNGNMWNHQNLGEMNCLEQVDISLTAYDVNDLDSVCEQFLRSISSVKVLQLDQVTAKTLFRGAFKPAPLCNVWYLNMSICCSIDDNLVPSITSLFRAVPNLTTLKVSSSPETPFRGGGDNLSGFDRGYWELQDLGFVPKLKKATIELTSGSNGFELAKFLLENACNLKRMCITITPDQSSLLPEIRRINPSSKARVVVLEKREMPRGRFSLTKTYV